MFKTSEDTDPGLPAATPDAVVAGSPGASAGTEKLTSAKSLQEGICSCCGKHKTSCECACCGHPRRACEC